MRLVERRQELVERDAAEISIMWKLLQMLFYLVSASSGCVTSYAFYIFQVSYRLDILSSRSSFTQNLCDPWKQDSLNNRCLLWAVTNFEHGVKTFFRSMTDVTEQPWQERLMVQFKSERHCYSILWISMLSCVCGTIGFSFFTICGRGGYNRGRVYVGATAPLLRSEVCWCYHMIQIPFSLAAGLPGDHIQLLFDSAELGSSVRLRTRI